MNPLIFCTEILPPEVRDTIVSLKPEGFDLVFPDTRDLEERVQKAREADFLMIWAEAIPARVIEAGKRLKLIQKWGIGLEMVDLAAAARRGVPVCNTAGGNAVPTSELTISLMLAVYRKLCFASTSLREGRWLMRELRMNSYELYGKTVGVIGAGHIGQAVGKRLSRGFECRVLYCKRQPLPDEKEAELGMVHSSLEDLLRESDIVTLHVPLTPQTHQMIGSREFSLMKGSAILVNTSRGPVVKEADLISALQNGTIAGAGLDVFEVEPPDSGNPLLNMDNVVATPHIGGATREALDRVLRHAFDNIQRAERGEPLPEADLALAKSYIK